MKARCTTYTQTGRKMKINEEKDSSSCTEGKKDGMK